MKQTREKIIQSARALFEENGFAATTTREIAAKAGVSEVTLFRHFETKRNLFDQTVHSSMHPYKLETYLQSDVAYDLETDIKIIAQNMMKTYRENLPMLRMIFKDKMHAHGDGMKKFHLKSKENDVRISLIHYFEVMRKMGRMTADPEMAFKFFMTNITGFFMQEAFLTKSAKVDQEYFDWMVDKMIIALRSEKV